MNYERQPKYSQQRVELYSLFIAIGTYVVFLLIAIPNPPTLSSINVLDLLARTLFPILPATLMYYEAKKTFTRMEEVREVQGSQTPQIIPTINRYCKSVVITLESTTASTKFCQPENERIPKVVPSTVDETLRELQTLQGSSFTGRIAFLLNQLEKQPTLSPWAIATARKFLNHPDSEIRAVVERISQRKESKYRRVIKRE